MTSLKDLNDPEELSRFLQEVSNNSKEQKEPFPNDNIKSSSELKEIIRKGSEIDFDCKFLIEND